MFLLTVMFEADILSIVCRVAAGRRIIKYIRVPSKQKAKGTSIGSRGLFRRRLSAEGAKPESNNRWKSDLGHVVAPHPRRRMAGLVTTRYCTAIRRPQSAGSRSSLAARACALASCGNLLRGPRHCSESGCRVRASRLLECVSSKC